MALLSIAAFVAYLRSPYQLIPENTPVFGYVDDFSILLFGLLASHRLMPASIATGRGPGRRQGAQAIAIGSDYAARTTEFGGAAVGSFGDDERSSRGWALYDWVGYRRAWQIKSLGRAAAVSAAAPIVIGGCGRSGTTLLRTIFNRHPRVFCGDESTVFLRRVSSPCDIGRRYGFDPDLVADMMRRTRSQVEFIEQFQAECLRRSGKLIWAEKTPDNVLRFEFIRRRFPNAHIVHVMRDGRDVVCSLRRQKWFKVPEEARRDLGTVGIGIDYWKTRVEAGLRLRGDARYHEVRYEELIDDPENCLRRLFQALGLEWVDSVMVPAAGPVVSRQAHEGTINSDALGQWRRELGDAETALIESNAGRLLRDLGYAG